MRKLKERFHRKHGVVSRIFSMVLALAMIMTMAPAIGGATTAYAASPTIRLIWTNQVHGIHRLSMSGLPVLRQITMTQEMPPFHNGGSGKTKACI